MGLRLCQGIRARYPEWRHLADGDGGDENLKDYPIEENPELTIRSVIDNLMLYQEGWGVGRIKHSLTYSGGLSRGYVRTYCASAPARVPVLQPVHTPTRRRGCRRYSVCGADPVRRSHALFAQGGDCSAGCGGAHGGRDACFPEAALSARRDSAGRTEDANRQERGELPSRVPQPPGDTPPGAIPAQVRAGDLLAGAARLEATVEGVHRLLIRSGFNVP